MAFPTDSSASVGVFPDEQLWPRDARPRTVFLPGPEAAVPLPGLQGHVGPGGRAGPGGLRARVLLEEQGLETLRLHLQQR